MPETDVLHVNVYQELSDEYIVLLMRQSRQGGNSPDNCEYCSVNPLVVTEITRLEKFCGKVQKAGGYQLLKSTDRRYEFIVGFMTTGLAQILTKEEYWKLHRAGVPNNKSNNSSSK
ncbi:hypothetical protein IPJ91_02185 [bacterium]|nr:MAG: hypothetical protein IPJ91_02185 [bacterium]